MIKIKQNHSTWDILISEAIYVAFRPFFWQFNYLINSSLSVIGSGMKRFYLVRHRDDFISFFTFVYLKKRVIHHSKAIRQTDLFLVYCQYVEGVKAKQTILFFDIIYIFHFFLFRFLSLLPVTNLLKHVNSVDSSINFGLLMYPLVINESVNNAGYR